MLIKSYNINILVIKIVVIIVKLFGLIFVNFILGCDNNGGDSWVF